MTVVTTTLPLIAGSCLNLLRIRGTSIPAITELIRLIIKAHYIKRDIANS